MDYQKLANNLMFSLNEQELREIEKEFHKMDVLWEILNSVDTENVAPMVYPLEVYTHALREDAVQHVLTQEEALQNAPEEKHGHFSVGKVVQ